ncbi:hypothetical protein AVEN_233898-1 [Araneus ventricosus]|uniref:Uncharacterized protein n=1 Tax=Araneus ventricosus TaxID=182803 RepID=A0A4Y2WMB3_ARAVE|nr:hypothetical protein AVEN_187787-1 [Araneus ventricosus]GBO37837.1 hypothetical protein AVEN_233898-1 [Araneus ventricosus]
MPQFVVVVGEAIDLSVIMTASTNSENIFFLKPGIGKVGDALCCVATLSIAPYNKGKYSVSSCVQWLRYHICSFQVGEEDISERSEQHSTAKSYGHFL